MSDSLFFTTYLSPVFLWPTCRP